MESVDYYNSQVDKMKRRTGRHDFIEKTLNSIVTRAMEVLDVGCGTGILTRAISKKGARVVGIDSAEELIKEALNLPSENIDYIWSDFIQWHSRGRKFDLICLIDVLEHIPSDDLIPFMAKVVEVSKPKSSLYLSIPDGRFIRYMRKNDPDKLQPIDIDYDIQEIINIMKLVGYEPVHIKIYGLDTPVQYNEYIFTCIGAITQIYKEKI
ncbi:hypothetical protein LCGC14_1344810 [marine sediment metagenome]|uniref:Methyltransferase domain-containing protein n=1 Tax=marine sediment metagenome TaxID=412755 RepID=A0A0F9KCN7_9ZZZZ|nr:class I SAM-dependent methyltransferase [Desulfobacterales bacterium]